MKKYDVIEEESEANNKNRIKANKEVDLGEGNVEAEKVNEERKKST